MFKWRNSLLLLLLFVVVGIVYYLGFSSQNMLEWDYAGMTMLILLGVAMGFGFAILLRTSRDL